MPNLKVNSFKNDLKGIFQTKGLIIFLSLVLCVSVNYVVFNVWLLDRQIAKAWSMIFETPIAYSTNSFAGPHAIADFNEDGNLDVVVSSWTNIDIFLGNGDGTVSPATPSTILIGTVNYNITHSDFNEDSHEDIAVIDEPENKVRVFLGVGDGTFGSPLAIDLGAYAGFVEAGDFNNDGDIDLLASSSGKISMILGNGDGTFQPRVDTIVTDISSIVVGDVDDDNDLDFISARGTWGLSVYKNNGSGVFTLFQDYTTVWPENFQVVKLADINNDSNEDLIVGGSGALLVDIVIGWLGNGDGTFNRMPSNLTEGYGRGPLAVTDFNGDSNIDFIVTGNVFLGNGDGTFNFLDQAFVIPINPIYCSVSIADLNQDLKPDIIFSDRSGRQFMITMQAPTKITEITSSVADGYYDVGEVIPIQVIFSGNVDVTGTPKLKLATGTPSETVISYISGSGSDILTFEYIVAAGNSSLRLDCVDSTSLLVNGGTIIDSISGNDAVLTLPVSLTSGSLYNNKNIIIDTVGPIVTINSPSNNGVTKMATPIIVQTDENATCSYKLDSGSDVVMANTGGTLHTDNLVNVRPGLRILTVSCIDTTSHVGVSSVTWNKENRDLMTLYGTDGQGSHMSNLYMIDSETGAIQQNVGPNGTCVTGLSLNPVTQVMYGVSSYTCPVNPYSLFTVEMTTGAATLVGELSGDLQDTGCGALGDIAFDLSGNLYGFDCNGSLYKVDTGTGSTTEVANVESWAYGNGLAFDLATNSLWWLPGGDTPSSAPYGYLYNVALDGSLISSLEIPNGSGDEIPLGAAALDRTGMLFAIRYYRWTATPKDLVVIDRISGAIVSIGPYNNDDMDMMAAIVFYPRPAFSYGTRPEDTLPPSDPQDLKIIANDNGEVKITWLDPTDEDFSQVVVDEKFENNVETEFMIKGVQEIVFANRLQGQTYSYKLRSADLSGNMSIGVTVQITIPRKGEVVEETPIVVLPPEVKIGDLVKAIGEPEVYYIGEDGKRHHFANELVYKTWYSDFSSIKTISSDVVAVIPLGKDVYIREGTYLVKTISDPKVYAIETGGILRWIENEMLALSLYGNSWGSKVVDLPADMFAKYTQGAAINTKIHPNGSIISYSLNTTIYYIENGKKKVVSPAIFEGSRLQGRFVIQDVSSDIVYETSNPLNSLTSVGYLK